MIDRVWPLVDALVQRAQACEGEPETLDVQVDLGDGRTLAGTVAGVVGDVLRTVTYSRLGARQRLAAWVRLLAVTAAHPERSFRTATIGRAPSGDGVRTARAGPVTAGDARAHLAVLVDLYDRGMREPLPLAPRAALAYATSATDPEAAGRKAWESDFGFDKEDKDPEHQLVHGGVVTFAQLLAERPRESEAGPGWDAAETTRFGRLTRLMWTQLLDHEASTTRP